MKTIYTEIEINAPAATIWRHLTDFSSYPHWNPLIISAEGGLEAGGRLKVTVAPPEARPMTFRPVVTRFDPNKELRWVGKLGGIPFLFVGEHCFRVEPVQGTVTRFIQSEYFSGLLVPVVWRSMSKSTKAGFEGMNYALKKRSENDMPNQGG